MILPGFFSEESGKKFKIGTPLEAEISKLLHGEQSTTEKNPFFKDHSRDLKAARQHLAEISKARWMARQKDAKDKYQSKLHSSTPQILTHLHRDILIVSLHY